MNCIKYLKRGWNRKEGRRNKDFKREGGQAGSRGRCLKRRGLEPPYELWTKKIHFCLTQKDCAILNVQYCLCFTKVSEMGGSLIKICVSCSIVLPDYVWTCNILALRAEMNPFEHTCGLQSLFRIQSLTFWHWTRYELFKFKTEMLPECPLHPYSSIKVGLIQLQETAKFGGPSRSADFCYHKFKNVSKAGVYVSTENNLFIKTLLIIAISPWSCL